MKFYENIKSLFSNRWFKFSVVTLIYILWFVVWTRSWIMLIGVPIIYDIYISKYFHKLYLNKYRAYKKEHEGFRKTMEWVEAFLYAMAVVIPLKLYFFGMYVIPSSSMEKTLMTGDYIFVNKIAYGPKMPNTPISFPFVHNTLPFSKTTPSYLEWLHWPYKRLAGYGQIERNDVVIFNVPDGDTVALGTMKVRDPSGMIYEQDVSTQSYYELIRTYGRKEVYDQTRVLYRPVDKRENYIKRCIGLPGDTVTISDGDVYVNGQLQTQQKGVQYFYTVSTNAPIPGKAFERMNIHTAEDFYYSAETGKYTLTLTDPEVEQMRSLPQVTDITRYVERIPTQSVFPHDPYHYPWSTDIFGPLWVPKAGVTVQLTPENLPLYERIIKNYEGNNLEIQQVQNPMTGEQDQVVILINDVVATEYTFRMDYYFMMGDNRHNSLDSRYWGFVPIDHIEGKAAFIWLSIEQGKNIFTGLRWSRMFTGIH